MLRGEELTPLANEAKLHDDKFLELREEVNWVYNNIINKYKRRASREDLVSIIDISFCHSVRTFNGNKGNFDYHFRRRADVETKRFLLKNSLIAIPEAVINLLTRMSDKDKAMLLNPINDEELADKYEITISRLQKARYIRSVALIENDYLWNQPKDALVFGEPTDSIEEVEQQINASVVEKVLCTLPKKCAEVLKYKFGLAGEEVRTHKQIAVLLDIGTESVTKLYEEGITILQGEAGKDLRGLI